jgi:hypothetical protein
MKKALIVGVDHYNDPIQNLDGCNAAAEAVSQLLKKNYSVDSEVGEPNFDCRVLISDPCEPKKRLTRNILRTQVKQLFEDDNADLALFFYSGYGFENSLGGYLMTQDAEEHEEGIAFDDIMIYANNSSVKEIIIVLDCHFEKPPEESESQLSKFAALRKGISILTIESLITNKNSASYSPFFPELFCHVLASGGDNDVLGDVTLSEVYTYTNRILQPLGFGVTFKSNASSMAVLRKAKPQIDYNILQKMSHYFPSSHFRVPLDPECLRSQSSTNEAKIKVYKDLQKMVRCGLVKPINEEHMYYAALHNEHCGLTEKGKQYWFLLRDKRI